MFTSRSLCLCLCLQTLSKSYERNLMKFSGGVGVADRDSNAGVQVCDLLSVL